MSARESRALRKLLREAPTSPYVFISERRAPLSAAGYQRMVARAGVAAKFSFLVHSHMLRHACGFKLANDSHDTRAIQAYLGHRSIMSTVRYTALTPNRQPAFLSLGGARAGVSLKPVQQFSCPFRFLVLCFEHAG
jgi:type 1 fimbriae regulatory protein FimB/type 1 fimbriae regulatory protein FimE